MGCNMVMGYGSALAFERGMRDIIGLFVHIFYWKLALGYNEDGTIQYTYCYTRKKKSPNSGESQVCPAKITSGRTSPFGAPELSE